MTESESFTRLVKILNGKGYNLKVEHGADYSIAQTGLKHGPYNMKQTGEKHNPVVIMATSCDWELHPLISGRIAAEHADAFDKMTRMPMSLPLPQTEAQLEYVIERLAFWASNEGYKISNEYDFDNWEEDYPERLRAGD